jgi:D-alanyl-D-alanine carboxypeptidase
MGTGGYRGQPLRARSGWLRRGLVGATLVTTVASMVILASVPASARVQPAPAKGKVTIKTAPGGVDAEILTPQQITDQVKAAEALRADLTKTGGEVAAANTRLEQLSAQTNRLLANLSATRAMQVDAETEASTQTSRLAVLGAQVQSTNSALGHMASDSYVHGGGPLGDVAAILEAITTPSADQRTDSLATVQYLVTSRARLLLQLKSVRSAQVTTTARAAEASGRAKLAAESAAIAKTSLDRAIVTQRAALEAFQTAQAAQVSKAAGLRGTLLRSQDPLAKAADKKLAQALKGQDYVLLVSKSYNCGKDVKHYPNGQWPAGALCPLYAAKGKSLRRSAAQAFNAMSIAHQRQTGSPLCVTDAYRSFAGQVAVKKAKPGLAATPGRSKHGLGLALDLCGGVQSFATPAHLWMKRNGPLYGWYHPGWAEPSGSLPEPWHWEFAN